MAQAGKLRHRITIQSPLSGTNPFQQASAAKWQNVLTCWARIQSVDPRESYNQGNETMKVSHLITMRHPGKNFVVGAGYQVLFGTRVFSLVGGIVNEDERNRTLQLTAWEINPKQGGQ